MIADQTTMTLVAPRPVRLPGPQFWYPVASQPSRCSTAFGQAEEASMSDRGSPISLQVPDSDPPKSPRSPSSSEALEEFLSILQPHLMSAPSVHRVWRHGSTTLPQNLAFNLNGKTLDITQVMRDMSLEDNSGTLMRLSPGTSSPTGQRLDALQVARASLDVQTSPISRFHTRNPFPRHYAHSSMPSPVRSSPSPLAMPAAFALSPSHIPLPLPSSTDDV